MDARCAEPGPGRRPARGGEPVRLRPAAGLPRTARGHVGPSGVGGRRRTRAPAHGGDDVGLRRGLPGLRRVRRAGCGVGSAVPPVGHPHARAARRRRGHLDAGRPRPACTALAATRSWPWGPACWAWWASAVLRPGLGHLHDRAVPGRRGQQPPLRQHLGGWPFRRLRAGHGAVVGVVAVAAALANASVFRGLRRVGPWVPPLAGRCSSPAGVRRLLRLVGAAGPRRRRRRRPGHRRGAATAVPGGRRDHLGGCGRAGDLAGGGLAALLLALAILAHRRSEPRRTRQGSDR